MSYFNFRKEIPDTKEKEKEVSPFKIVYKIYDIINKPSKYYIKDLDIILNKYEDNDLNFICWILNHYLFYNKFTRENFETIMINNFLTSKEYIYFYVKFMIENKLKFPKFMSWYKLNITGEDKKYLEIVKEASDISDEEKLESFISYFREKNITLRDFCINLEYIK